ncbi:MAG: glycerol kinase GlpK [Acidimicrobiia bacterium]
MAVVIAIDAGTTGVRAFALGDNGVPLGYSYREFGQYFPQPGWVEHDAGEILAVTQLVLAELVAKLGEVTIVALGITNQRETTVAWSRSTGQPFARAIVWQDRRTADRCADLRAAGHEQRIREITGLVTDPYFSATKMAWLYEHADVPRNSDTAFGTIDTWLLWNLTGGAHGGVFATEPSNASRTMLMDLATLEWSEECLELFDVDRSSLPDIRSSSERYGMTQPDCAAGLTVPISGIAGDQQAALFGQGCFEPGMTKNTYGTGSFVLTNLGTVLPDPVPGLLNTVAWKLGDAPAHYAMEGAIFITGAAVQWLRDGLGIIEHASETEALALSVPDAGGVVIVPAFAGLGSPHWDAEARGTIFGITRGSTRANLARAVLESMVHQTNDVLEAITAASGVAPLELRVDGGASAMDSMCQMQADVSGIPVRRSAVAETTALGAAYLAGIAEGVWDSPAAVSKAWHDSGRFEPTEERLFIDLGIATWKNAVERTRSSYSAAGAGGR